MKNYPPCERCGIPHRYGTTDYDHAPNATACINVLKDEIEDWKDKARSAYADGLAAANTLTAFDHDVLNARLDATEKALEHVSQDHFTVFGQRCRCGCDECPVIAAMGYANG